MPAALTVVTSRKKPIGVPLLVVARKVAPVPAVTVPMLRRKVPVTVTPCEVDGFTVKVPLVATVMVLGSARWNSIVVCRETLFAVAVTRAVAGGVGLARSAVTRYEPSAVRVTVAAFSGLKRPAVSWNCTDVPSGSEGDSCTVNDEIVAPSAGAVAGAATKSITALGSAAVKLTVRLRDSPVTFSTFADTTALPTCCELLSSTVAVPVTSVATATWLEEWAVPTSVPALVEKSTVRLSASASGEILAMMRSREMPSAGIDRWPFAVDSTSASAGGGVGGGGGGRGVFLFVGAAAGEERGGRQRGGGERTQAARGWCRRGGAAHRHHGSRYCWSCTTQRPGMTLPSESRIACSTSTVISPPLPGPVVMVMRSTQTCGSEPTVSSRTTCLVGLPSPSSNQMLCAEASEYCTAIASEASELRSVCWNSTRLGSVVGLGEASRSLSTKIAMACPFLAEATGRWASRRRPTPAASRTG